MEPRELIEEIVQKQGVTRYRIAKELGVHTSNVYSWEKGRTKPTGKHLLELLKRAGRIAAAIALGVAVGAVAEPGEAQAGVTAEKEAKSGIHIIRKWVLRLMLRCHQYATAPTLAI